MKPADLPDLGAELASRNCDGDVRIDPFAAFRVCRLGPKEYLVLGRRRLREQWFVGSVLMSEPEWRAFLAILPLQYVVQIEQGLGGGVPGEYQDFPMPFPVGLSVTVGPPTGEGINPDRALIAKRVGVARGDSQILEEEAFDDKFPLVAVDREESVVLLQASLSIGKAVKGLDALSVAVLSVLGAFLNARSGSEPRVKSGWTAYAAIKPHWSGKNFWVGIAHAPPKTIDEIQARLEKLGTEVEREMSDALREGMTPIVRVTKSDAWIFVPEGMTPPSTWTVMADDLTKGAAKLAYFRLVR